MPKVIKYFTTWSELKSMERSSNDCRFTVRFNPEIEKHRFAIEELSKLGRTKANLIANAIYHYKNRRVH